MKKYSGKGVYGAIAIGKISVLKKNDAAVTRVHVEDAAAEKARVEKAKQAAAEQLQAIHDKALKEVGEANAQIFEIHIMMLEDEDYNESIANIIDTQQVNAEYAVAVTSDNFAEMFAAMDDAYMQARSADVRDISNRIIANLTGTADSSAESCDSMIVCADDLAPSETVALDKDKVLAFVTAHGSSNSHTAILARNMNIPAVIGMGDEFLTEISSGTPAIVDGYTGTVIVDPDEATVAEYTAKRTSDEEKSAFFRSSRARRTSPLTAEKSTSTPISAESTTSAPCCSTTRAASDFSAASSCILRTAIFPPRSSSSTRTSAFSRAWLARRSSYARWISALISR